MKTDSNFLLKLPEVLLQIVPMSPSKCYISLQQIRLENVPTSQGKCRNVGARNFHLWFLEYLKVESKKSSRGRDPVWSY